MFFLSVRMSNSSGSWQGDVSSAEVGICSVVPSVQEGERGGEALNDAWRAIVNNMGHEKQYVAVKRWSTIALLKENYRFMFSFSSRHDYFAAIQRPFMCYSC